MPILSLIPSSLEGSSLFPKARVMIEGTDESTIHGYAEEIAEVMRKELAGA